MKRFALLLASTAFITPAFAADVIYEEPPAPAAYVEPTAAYNWSGFYVGGQAGVAFNRDSGAFSTSDNQTFVGGNDGGETGFIGGGHVGYDQQIGSNFLIGAVADLNYIDAEANTSFTLPTANGGATFGVNQDIEYVGTVRAKAGVTMDRFALYATGGLAYAGIENETYGDVTYTSGGNTYDVRTSEDSDSVGYAVGAGFDVLATQNVSFGLEYLYTDLGESSVEVDYTNQNGLNTGDFTADSNSDLNYHSVLAKASYRFN